MGVSPNAKFKFSAKFDPTCKALNYIEFEFSTETSLN